MGCTAAVSPFDATTSAALRRDYLREARSHDLSIGEVGVWRNVMSPDPTERRQWVRYAKDQLALADDIGARCCVNISGNAGPGGWDQYSPENYADGTYEHIVETTQDIIDAVDPRQTVYTIECMPWMVPDSPHGYLQLIKDVDRTAFATHLDYTNMIHGIDRWRALPAFIDECFDLLAAHIVSVHIKDIRLHSGLPTSITEVGSPAADRSTSMRCCAGSPSWTTPRPSSWSTCPIERPTRKRWPSCWTSPVACPRASRTRTSLPTAPLYGWIIVRSVHPTVPFRYMSPSI